MALNPNHTFEELGEVKCAVVEKNCTAARVAFLQSLLEHNGFKVVAVKSPAPKAAAAKPAVVAASTDGTETAPPPPPAEPVQTGPETFTLGVTDLSFNPGNAVFNRELKTKDGRVVTPKYWQQKENESHDEIWYWKTK